MEHRLLLREWAPEATEEALKRVGIATGRPQLYRHWVREGADGPAHRVTDLFPPGLTEATPLPRFPRECPTQLVDHDTDDLLRIAAATVGRTKKLRVFGERRRRYNSITLVVSVRARRTRRPRGHDLTIVYSASHTCPAFLVSLSRAGLAATPTLVQAYASMLISGAVLAGTLATDLDVQSIRDSVGV